MKRKYNILLGLLMFFVALTWVSCSDNENPIPKEEIKTEANLLLSIKTSALLDALAKGEDSKFSSLAIYIFNKSDGYCEYSELIPNFTPETVSEYTRSVEVTSQTKIVYAIGNYMAAGVSVSGTLSSSTTMQELENLTASNTAPFSDTGILMIGKQEVDITSVFVEAEIPMERLVARLDVYIFKNEDLKNDSVRVKSVEFVNQVTNSNFAYQNNSMMSPVSKARVLHTIEVDTILYSMPSTTDLLIPENAHSSFYSYQNIATSTIPDSTAVTPYLRITITINGVEYVYAGYITDDGQTTNKYSLLRNTVYRIIAMLRHPDNGLELKIVPLQWDVTESEIGHEVKDTDFSLEPFNGDVWASTGIVQYPYRQNGLGMDMTSYAAYSFKLTGPKGAVWAANLTNGLDFTFGTNGSETGKKAVSKGIARDDAYEIKVGATKSWGGKIRNTYMYITVGGVKLKINPIQSDNTRKFPGSNDTDILIRQTEYQ